jgi:hypothetical protein
VAYAFTIPHFVQCLLHQSSMVKFLVEMTESNSPYNFVELNRTFHELSRYAGEGDEVDLSHVFHIGRSLGWSDLIGEYRVVLLSEAGSGKTEEIRNIAQKLRGDGKVAFFIRLEHIPNDFEDAFEVGSFEQFQAWLASGEEGWLFLDSVDEARLRSPGDFELAIKKLGRRVSTAKDRAHIVITGRAPAWRPRTDLSLCTLHLPFTLSRKTESTDQQTDNGHPPENVNTKQKDKRQDSPFKIVALDDLSSGQVEIFARARGVTDTAAFLNAVERADAQSFTARPQDLEELTEFWVDQGRIGSRLELMRNSIARRLTERDQDRADTRPLSMDDARHGARLLAAATTLGQEPTIRVPDGADNSKGIAVRDVLPGWDDNKQAALLSRPIFDEAIYGTVRFHHRSVREYLTAEWLAELLRRETSRRKIEALFFRNQYGLDVIVPTLRPVLPWLAILDDKVRERLRKIAPEVVFEGGDPSQLPLDTRRTILHEVCEQMASGTSSRSVADYDAVQRFANTDLTHDIRSLIEKYDANDELKGFLLRMIWLGELRDALPEAKTAALSASLSTYTRIAAFRAVKAVGSEKDCEEIRRAFLGEAPELNRDWLAELIQESTPSPDMIAWLLTALAKSGEKERFSADRLTEAVGKFAQATDLVLLPKLVSGLNNLLNQPPVIERRYCEVSQKFGWLLKAAAQSVERLIRERHPAALEPAVLSVLRKFCTSRNYGTDNLHEKIEVAALVPEWPELNRALFWYDVEESRAGLDKKRGERLNEFWRASVFGGYWRFDKQDFDYVADQIECQTVGDNRLVALSLAFRLYVDNGRPRKWREKLKALVASDSELSARFKKYLNPSTQSAESRKWKQQEAKWKRQSEERKRKEQENRDKCKVYLAENIDKLRNPGLPNPQNITNAQSYLLKQMWAKDDRLTRWTRGDWRCLIDEYGEAVARAFRDGAVAHWRRYKPKLQSEGAPSNETPLSVIFGLTGLGFEAKEAADWPGALSAEEIDIACRYASHELNGFPAWFPRLFEKHPKPVGDFLLNEIRYELTIEKPEHETHYILSDVSWSGDWAWDMIAPELMTLLGSSEPANLMTLSKMLTIVQGSSVSDEEIGSLAANKCKSLPRHDHLALWFAVWTGVDPVAAIPALAKRVSVIATPEGRSEMAMNYLISLLEGRRGESCHVRAAFQTPQHLKSLYLLMHEHIRRKDDIDRTGEGVFSPGPRDNAQAARDTLFTLLNRIPGKEAFLALEEISKTHPEEPSRSWFVLHAKTKAQQDADIGPWAPSQVWEFQDTLERTPSNHSELADLAAMRLLDLKDDIENGDSSIAQLLQKVTLETGMRKFIGRELREKASGRYSIPQEEELADAKRPDLRFQGNGFDGPVPVELKLADKWTGPALFERLENQLCGDYLRDNRSDRGLLVLVYSGKKKGWDVPGASNRVDFAGLVAALQAHWEQISPRFIGVEEITVIGIDLTKRFRSDLSADGKESIAALP